MLWAVFRSLPNNTFWKVDTELPKRTVVAMTKEREEVTMTYRLGMLSSILSTRPKATAPLIIPASAMKHKSLRESPDLYLNNLVNRED